jgi:aminoglycoside N3'-acetyltransferase
VDDLVLALQSVGLGPDQVIQLHVDLSHVPGQGFKDRAETVWRALCLACPGATFIVPTFTYACGDGGAPYDKDRSPSELGFFSEWCRRRGWPRSDHPVFSFVANGPEQNIVDNVDPITWGTNSVFGRMLQRHARIAFIDAPFQSCTFVHKAEWDAGVPYREAHELAGGWWIYRRRPGVPNADLSGIEPRLMADGVLTRAIGGPLVIMAAPCRLLGRHLVTYLECNPYVWTRAHRSHAA